jgi:hypothetical protein
MTNYSLITLGELLSSENETIKRNAVSILKVLQKLNGCIYECERCGATMQSQKGLCNSCSNNNR